MELEQIKLLKARNQQLLGVEYKLDLSFFMEPTEKAQHLLLWKDEELLGYTALSAYNPEEVELTMIAATKEAIAPMHEAVCLFAQKKQFARLLWIVDQRDDLLVSFIKKTKRYNYSFSEYAMLFDNETKINVEECSLVSAAKVDATKIARLDGGADIDKVQLIDDDDLAKTLVFKEGEELIASIRLEKNQEECGIYGFIVRVDQRGKGIGRKMLTTIVSQLVREGYSQIYLEVESTNAAAMGLYQSIGFKQKACFDYYLSMG
ncbi:GNAT family N-acetyltransferase [Enterococcus wangshanyuanii]|uniref:N-acetyltransferase n=1 Tax=Enterococcus wangshanyuanii TaxID=2005703 RepID=A0ABQ1NMN1_9ENTE|nr:GNAT family N-acetyltransferase [Enterococcus wangshanyuanii]GGC80832.1 N-acetyltransferase [Enterococcus wangshanyuanii]